MKLHKLASEFVIILFRVVWMPEETHHMFAQAGWENTSKVLKSIPHQARGWGGVWHHGSSAPVPRCPQSQPPPLMSTHSVCSAAFEAALWLWSW